MARYVCLIGNHRRAVEFLGGRNHRQVAPNTYIEWEGWEDYSTILQTKNIYLRYYNTKIVTYHPDGTATFFLGERGNNLTTRRRIRQIVLPYTVGCTWQLVSNRGLKWQHSLIPAWTTKRLDKANKHLLTEYEFRDYDRITIDKLNENFYRPIIWDKYEG